MAKKTQTKLYIAIDLSAEYVICIDSDLSAIASKIESYASSNDLDIEDVDSDIEVYELGAAQRIITSNKVGVTF